MVMKLFNYKGNTFYDGQDVTFDYYDGDALIERVPGKLHISSKSNRAQQLFLLNNQLDGSCPDGGYDRKSYRYSWWVSTEDDGMIAQCYDMRVPNINFTEFDSYEII
jgi:hypothetical protein